MGFLAEVSGEGIPKVIEQLARNDYRVDTPMTLDVTVRFPDGSEVHDWALNEAVLIHTDVAHPVQLALVVDGQDVSTTGPTASSWQHPPAPLPTPSLQEGQWSGRIRKLL